MNSGTWKARMKGFTFTEFHERRFWEKVDIKQGQCWEWQGAFFNSAYGKTVRQKNYKQTFFLAHRLSYAFAYADFNEDLCILHHCDNPPCVNPEHLYQGTVRDNMRDRDRRGRQSDKRGEKNGRAKLTLEAVRKIRGLFAGGVTMAYLAKENRVSPATIFDIVHWRRWKYD